MTYDTTYDNYIQLCVKILQKPPGYGDMTSFCWVQKDRHRQIQIITSINISSIICIIYHLSSIILIHEVLVFIFPISGLKTLRGLDGDVMGGGSSYATLAGHLTSWRRNHDRNMVTTRFHDVIMMI